MYNNLLNESFGICSSQIVLVEVAFSSEELNLGRAERFCPILQVDQLQCACHVSRLEETIIRWCHPTELGIEQNVEDGVDDVSYLLLPTIVVDDDLVESLKV